MIWYAEDDSSIRDIGLYALKSAGFETRGFDDGISLWNALKKESPELIVLDIMLPGMDGLEILSLMKDSVNLRNIPVIMATAKGEEYDRVSALDIGADDYIVKPFSIIEMVARVKAVLRRSAPDRNANILKVDKLVMNMAEHTVHLNNKLIDLTYKEFELLSIFLLKPGIVHTREQIFNQVWNLSYIKDSRTLDSHIRSLRKKLGKYGEMIKTIRNIGYRWEEEIDR